MAGNQREMERRERRADKERKHKRIVWTVIAVIIAFLAIMKICEININSVKNHFTDSEGNFTLTDGVVEDNYPYILDASQNVSVININNKLGVVTPSSFTVLNSKDATVEYSFEHGYSNPVFASSGIYSLIYDQGSNDFRLDTVSSAVYEHSSAKSILCGDVSKNGNVVLATTSSEKLCDIKVFSKTLKELFSISLSDGYVISAAISDNGKRIALAAVNGENADIVTNVYMYDVSSASESIQSVTLPQGLLIDLNFCGNTLYTVGDTYAGVIKKSGEYTDVFENSGISTRCFTYSPSGELIIAYNSYSNSSDNVVAYIKSSGKIKTQINVDSNIKSVTATSSLVSILTNSRILSYNLSNGEEKERLSADDSAKSICAMGSEVFVQKQSVIDRSVENDD